MEVRPTPTKTTHPLLLGFSPQLLLDDIINTANNAVQDGVDGMEEFLQKWADEKARQNTIRPWKRCYHAWSWTGFSCLSNPFGTPYRYRVWFLWGMLFEEYIYDSFGPAHCTSPSRGIGRYDYSGKRTRSWTAEKTPWWGSFLVSLIFTFYASNSFLLATKTKLPPFAICTHWITQAETRLSMLEALSGTDGCILDDILWKLGVGWIWDVHWMLLM